MIFICVSIVALFLIIPYFAGYYSSNRIEPGSFPGEENFSTAPSSFAEARIKYITETYEAVGTVRPRTETKIEAQVTGKVLKVYVKPGDNIKKGAKLVSLENDEYKTRLERSQQGLRSAQALREQAKQGIQAAQARYDKTESQYNRKKKLFKDNVLSTSELEQAESEFLQSRAELTQVKEGFDAAEAGVKQAQKLVEEARILLNYTEIRATEDAEIAKRLVEPGDLAVPGKPLLVVQTIGAMRLEAFVREGLIRNIQVGEELTVSIGAIEKQVTGFVEEIVPSADPKTRTFLVKVGLPYIRDLYPGMFGRLIIPSGKRQAVLIPIEAIRKVGQLETVLINEGGNWKKIYIKTGKKIDDMVEVLSGLNGDETLGILGKENA
jgi:RND family efflux transporter MFP subunit